MFLSVRRLLALTMTFLLLNKPITPIPFNQGKLIVDDHTLRYEEANNMTKMDFDGRIYLAQVVPLGEEERPTLFVVEGDPLPGKEKTLHAFQGPDFHEVAAMDATFMNPWDLKPGYSTEPVLAVGVYKSTYDFPEPDKRPFLFTIKDGEFLPVWLGSSLARPFEDFIFLPESHDLVALEYGRTGMLLRRYRWWGFGFDSEYTPYPLKNNAYALEIQEDNLLVKGHFTVKIKLEELENFWQDAS